MKKLTDSLAGVNSQKSMADFIALLLDDYSNNKDQWVNNDLDSFLEALAAWVEDMDAYYNNTNQDYDEKNISWKIFADMLMASKVYE